MRIGRKTWPAVAGGIFLALSGCGDHNNFFGSIADDTSTDAKIEDAQIALDKGDCQAAIDGFTSAFNHDPANVGYRVNLAAAYTCRAGFNIPALIRIVADYISQGQSDSFNLFAAIAESAVKLVSTTWPNDTSQAILYLRDPDSNLLTTTECSPPPFGNNSDAAFNEAIVQTIRGVMAAVITGGIPASSAKLVGEALRDADSGIACANSIAGGNVIVDSDVAKAIHDLNVGLNDMNCTSGASSNDACHVDDLSSSELQQYLSDRGFTFN